jgi:Spy/CpxP family protein refolding chaperone
MFRAFLCWLVLLSFVLLPSISRGEDIYPGKWWRIPEVAEKLALTDAQKQQLDTLFMSNRGRLVELKSALERERTELNALLEKEPVDEAAIMTQLKKLESARTDLSSERLRFGLEVRKILGYERFQDLKSFFKAYREKRAAPKKQSRLGRPGAPPLSS